MTLLVAFALLGVLLTHTGLVGVFARLAPAYADFIALVVGIVLIVLTIGVSISIS